jgi:glycosyltransferase involved in cell wall biosynthesis
MAKRTLTICLPYYRNAGQLELQFERIRSMSHDVLSRIAVIVVDDGSPDGDAKGWDIGCPLAIFKIGVDVRWNQDAARNIAAHHAETPWLLLTDIDHLIPQDTVARLVMHKLRKDYVYRFARTTLERTQDGLIETTPYKPHPNSWGVTKQMYWRTGGYDERFAGFYGTDADFRDRLRDVCTDFITLPEHLVRVPRETQADASTTHYLRKQPEDKVGIRRVKAERAGVKNWKPLALSFPYRRIYP